MNFEIIQNRDFVEVKLNIDSLSVEYSNELKGKILQLIENGEKKIVMNLGQTRYIDSSGIGKLLFFNKKLMNENGIFEINSIHPELYDFLDSLAITKVIKIKKP